MSTPNKGFKLTRVDGTTHGGYRWPLPMPGERVLVEASNPTEHGSPCPRREGDGLCVALSARGASSGGIAMSHAIGLWLEWRDEDVLARDLDKLRVRSVTVAGVFDPLRLIRSGGYRSFIADLRDASLLGADLRDAYLRDADLRGANLRGAYGRDDWSNLIARGAIR